MHVATYVLLALGILGAIDIALYHTVAHGIRTHPDSRWELAVHALRGPTYATLFWVVPNLSLQGGWFWGLIALLAADAGISMWDFAIERGSRAFLGGLPTGEYVLHILIAMLFGALVTSILLLEGGRAGLATAVRYAPADVWGPVRVLMGLMGCVVLYSGGQDALAAWRMWKAPIRG